MNKPLRLLMVEDNSRDAELVLRELRRGGFDVHSLRVDTAEAMSAALETQSWDLVISDYDMPRFSASAALALMKARNFDLPFIIVSGTVGEEAAVASLRAGAHDFVTKDKLARLMPAIERELADAAGRAERAQMQEQLVISSRMASVGTLAAGVAHEINNPLAALIANLQFVADDVATLEDAVHSAERAGEPPSNGWLRAQIGKIAEPLTDAREAADRIRLIVRDLKTFSRGDEDKLGTVEIHRVLKSALRMAGNEIRHRARLVEDYGEVPMVHGNEGRLGQVFLNLLLNAAQAIPEGRADQNEIRIVTRSQGAGVIVEIRDTGEGIPEAILSRIFDPFFTTKPVGTGTGLGLAICHRIVTALDGQLVVESEFGVGTLVRVMLRVAEEQVADLLLAPKAVIFGNKGRLLVIDDEPLLLTAVRRMLSAEHEVVAVATAREAMLRLSAGERFGVILCDLMMPDVTGMDLYAELQRFAPEQAAKIVFMTGGAFTSRAREFLDQVENPRIEKPFDIDELGALVRDLLRERGN